MDVEILDENDSEMSFTLKNTHISIANALRRTILSEVPTIAIDLVRIESNNSVWSDEYIAHRLALVPISITRDVLQSMKFPNECQCISNGCCNQCGVLFELNSDSWDAEGSNSSVSGSREVTTGELYTNHPLFVNCFKSRPNIPIAEIKQGQSIKFTALARKGIAQDHAKWAASTVVVMKHQINVNVDQNIWKSLPQGEKIDFIKSCPAGVFGTSSAGNKYPSGTDCVGNKYPSGIKDIEDLGSRVLQSTDHVSIEQQRCTMCGICVDYADLKLKQPKLVSISIEEPAENFRFTVESVGQLSPHDIVLEALHVLRNKLLKLKTNLDLVNE